MENLLWESDIISFQELQMCAFFFLATGDIQILYGQSAEGFQLRLFEMEPTDY